MLTKVIIAFCVFSTAFAAPKPQVYVGGGGIGLGSAMGAAIGAGISAGLQAGLSTGLRTPYGINSGLGVGGVGYPIGGAVIGQPAIISQPMIGTGIGYGGGYGGVGYGGGEFNSKMVIM